MPPTRISEAVRPSPLGRRGSRRPRNDHAIAGRGKRGDGDGVRLVTRELDETPRYAHWWSTRPSNRSLQPQPQGRRVDTSKPDRVSGSQEAVLTILAIVPVLSLIAYVLGS